MSDSQMAEARNFCDIDYISTRGGAPDLGFRDVVLTGLAQDGGLYVPRYVPKLNPDDFTRFKDAPYTDVAFEVLSAFMGHIMPDEVLKGMIDETYKAFHHKDVSPITRLTDQMWVMEQFHGPTLAFKDFALQLLGRIFDYILNERDERITIVGATSGDTGSAAIEGCRGRDNMDIFILYPHGRVSEVQRRQMTTVHDKNVHNIALEGSFDDCQDLVKAMFNDAEFRKDISMSAVNSINWARIMAQVVYYVYASSRVDGKVSFFVPTGNFGNIYAGYLARQMGAPIDRLIVATNRNDILARFFETGEMSIKGVEPSLSPSMDIQISSNFERLYFDALGRDADALAENMQRFRKEGRISVDENVLSKMKEVFAAYRTSDEDTKAITKRIYDEFDYVIDPHTATGIKAVYDFMDENLDYDGTCIALSTAHPAKFPDAVTSAIGVCPDLPPWLSDLHDREERFEVLPNDLETVKDYIRKLAP